VSAIVSAVVSAWWCCRAGGLAGRRGLAFTRGSFVYSGIVHWSKSFLAFNTSFIARPPLYFAVHIALCMVPPRPPCFAIQPTILVMAISCKSQVVAGEVNPLTRSRRGTQRCCMILWGARHTRATRLDTTGGTEHGGTNSSANSLCRVPAPGHAVRSIYRK